MKFLILQHVPHEHPGYISQYAQDKNVTLDVIELWKPYKIPHTGNYNGIIILGGPMAVYENFPSEEDELQIIKNNLGKTPIMGICLGSQLLAYALGADVHPNIVNGKKIKEVGYFNVDLTDEGKNSSIIRGFSSPVKVLQWHGDSFDVPQGAKLLARSLVCANQAFSFRNSYGFLFHFEFTSEMVEKQIEIDKEWIHKDNEIDEQILIKEAKANAPLMKKQCYQLLDNFLSQFN